MAVYIDPSLLPTACPPVFSPEHNKLLEQVYHLDEGKVLWLYSGNEAMKAAAMAIVDKAAMERIPGVDRSDDVPHPRGHERRGAAYDFVNNSSVPDHRRESQKPKPGPSLEQTPNESLQPAPIIITAPGSRQTAPSSKRDNLRRHYIAFLEDHDLTASEYQARIYLREVKYKALQHDSVQNTQKYWHHLRATTKRYIHRLNRQHNASSRPEPIISHIITSTTQTRLENQWVERILNRHSPATLQTAHLMHQNRITQKSPSPTWIDAMKLLVSIEDMNANRPYIVQQYHALTKVLCEGQMDLTTYLRYVMNLFGGQHDLLWEVKRYWMGCWPRDVRFQDVVSGARGGLGLRA